MVQFVLPKRFFIIIFHNAPTFGNIITNKRILRFGFAPYHTLKINPKEFNIHKLPKTNSKSTISISNTVAKIVKNELTDIFFLKDVLVRCEGAYVYNVEDGLYEAVFRLFVTAFLRETEQAFRYRARGSIWFIRRE